MDFDKSVEFLYKTMMERDPHKRRVKPVQPHLLQLEFAALGSSSDDSDFKVNSEEEDEEDRNTKKSDDENDTDDAKSETKSTQSKRSGKQSSSSSDNDEDESTSDGSASSNQKSKCSIDELTEEMNSLADDHVKKKFDIQICSVCLGDSSKSEDEIIECDGCFVTVHEGCYGSVDIQSVASSGSSSSTEPWFCDSCKAGLKPFCELCPNTGGIFKETETGRWVHLVCALYTPGVAFGDVDQLNNVTLFEMSYAKYGAKECTLCEDSRFNRVGVCISCDAGLCKANFHVSCAQKYGFLSEASANEDVADPFFAHCKQHADKMQVKQLRKNWLTLQAQIRDSESKREANDVKIQSKLLKHQSKYQALRLNRKQGWIPKEKLPRMLLTNGYALNHLIKKAEFLGLDTRECSNNNNGNMVRKKGFVPPAFNSDFFNYYIERNDQIALIEQNINELSLQKCKWETEERFLNSKYDKLQNEITELTVSSSNIKNAGLKIWEYLTDIYGKRIRVPDNVSFKDFIVTPTKTPLNKLSPLSSLRHKCSLCERSNKQHQLVQCDRCQKHQHLFCLDPPLTKMPKKSKQQEWHCSSCNDDETKSVGDDEASVDVNQPRQLRNKKCIKQPLKYVTSKQQLTQQPRQTIKQNKMKRTSRKNIIKKTPIKRTAISEEFKNKMKTESLAIYEISSDDSNMVPPIKLAKTYASIRQSPSSSNAQKSVILASKSNSSPRALFPKRPSILSKSPIRKNKTLSPSVKSLDNSPLVKSSSASGSSLFNSCDVPIKYVVKMESKSSDQPISMLEPAPMHTFVHKSPVSISISSKLKRVSSENKPKPVIILAASRNLNKEFAAGKKLETNLQGKETKVEDISIDKEDTQNNLTEHVYDIENQVSDDLKKSIVDKASNLNLSTSTEEDNLSTQPAVD